MENIILIESLVKALLATKESNVEEEDCVVEFGNMSIKEQKKNAYILTTDLYPIEIELGYDEEGKATSLTIFVGTNHKFLPTNHVNNIQQFNNITNVIDYVGSSFLFTFEPSLVLGDFQIYFQNYKKGIITIGRLCPICKKYHTVDITKDQFENWLCWYFAEPGYEHIQNALPELSAKEREVFITGIEDECFQSMYDIFNEE